MGGAKRTLYAALAKICLGLENWMMKKADWLHACARWAERKSRGVTP